MKLQSTIGMLALLAAFGAHAQYKYVGPDGKVVYSDQPPPSGAKVLDKKGLPAQSTGGPELPYALKSASQTYPVTLYTAGNCGTPCSEGRNYLVKRGIPFTEKTVNTADDAAKFKKDLSTDKLPVLTVGNSKQTQWQQDGWASALNAAGYPADSQLPQGYKNPAPAPVAPPAATSQTASNQGAAPAANGAPSAPPPAASSGGDKPTWFKGF
ncbi:MAG TPA: glutaredoxin family protein [Burkholderiales bacterium]|jgi:hypothetical protein